VAGLLDIIPFVELAGSARAELVPANPQIQGKPWNVTAEATEILAAMRDGDESAAARLLPLVYDQLRALAERYFRGQPAGHTLQPTALVHEAFLRLVDRDRIDWRDRTHFVATCALAMRGILADHARGKAAVKRGGGRRRVTLSGIEAPEKSGEAMIDALDLDDALLSLEALNARQARIAEYRLFGGLTIEEIAYQLRVSRATIENDWAMARAWLSARLSEPAASPPE